MPVDRRTALAALGGLAAGLRAAAPPVITLSTFRADVTVPIGHPLIAGAVAPAKKVADPLEAIGFVLRGGGDPVVVCVVDWCEIRNDAHDAWRQALADAAGTTPGRVLVSSVHQHDAPVVDLEAERILKAAKATGSVCDLDFHEKAVRRVAAALKAGLRSARRVTHVGTGMAKVEKVGSNRRYVDRDGKEQFGRMSATRDAFARSQPEGLIDPYLRTLSFWDGDSPLAALSAYALHPMSYYGKGEVSADFVGQARRRRQVATPGVVQVYASGCSGNIVAGKYNDGSPENRPVLAGRMLRAMEDAWKDTRRVPLTHLGFRSVPYRLEPRGGAFAEAELRTRLKAERPFHQALAAMGLSWRKRADAGRKLDLPVLEVGPARLLLMPGESYVEFQLHAQKVRPDLFVMTLGYGECATGYVPTERHFEVKDPNLGEWCWVAPGAEAALKAAVEKALRR